MPCINWTVLVCGHKWTGVGWNTNKRIFKLHKNWYVNFIQMYISFSPRNSNLNMADRSEYNYIYKSINYFQCAQLQFRNSIVIQCCAVQNHALVRKMQLVGSIHVANVRQSFLIRMAGRLTVSIGVLMNFQLV